MILPASYHTGFAPRDGYPMYPELWRGCVGAWAPSLGPTGLTLRDWSGRQNHGTLTNMVPGDDWVVSGGRYALDFDGVNDNVTMAASVIFPGSSITITAWVVSRDVGKPQVLINQGNTTNQFILFYQFGWRLRGASAAEFIFGSLTNNVWSHVAVTTNGASAIGYVNGRFSSTGTIDPIAATLATNLEIGRYAPFGSGFYWNGQLDDIRIYNRALTESEIRLLASSRGIAYEMYRPTYYTPPISARRRKLLTGQV